MQQRVEEACAAPRKGQQNTRPSEYLRRRCPLCFGGHLTHDNHSKLGFRFLHRVTTDNVELLRVDVIVCLDACFTQKRRRRPQGHADEDEPHRHPDTLFLSREMVHEMEAYMTARKNRCPQAATTDNDGFEGPLKVPTSVLDECNDSFTAADEKRQKASTQFFADTGLMALLCRHDRVLWLVNITSASEKQHYAVALLRHLFKHLPANMNVGALYDIGCQLHRSFIKWDLLPEFRDRLVFALSIFHAYGH